jgi:dihydroorotase
MSEFDLVVRGGAIATPSGLAPGDLVITGGSVQRIADPAEGVKGKSELDATGKIILPGLVDAHMHIPGFFLSHRLDDFATASSAAAAGGVTTLMIMPTEDPRTINGRYFSLKRRVGEAQSFVDFAIQALIGPMTERAEVIEMADLGAVSFELFLAYGGNPGFIVGHDDYELSRILSLVRDVGAIAGVTPHSGSMIARLTEIEKDWIESDQRRRALQKEKASRTPVEHFGTTRPILSEALGISRACTVAAETGTPIHLRALSSRRSLGLVKKFSDWVSVTSEVMSHHLLFSADEVRAMGPYGIIVPPIRPREERDFLRGAVHEGQIDMVVSDHSPVLREDKELGWQSIWQTAPGMPGLQTLLLTMLWLVDQDVLTLEDVVRSCAERPAKRFGLYPRKGALEPGSDADFIVLNPKRQTLVKDADQLSKAGYTTFKGHKVNAAIEQVFLRGRLIAKDQKVVTQSHGQFVQPASSHSDMQPGQDR